MATKNIEINYYNGKGYDVLYPKTRISNVLNANKGNLILETGNYTGTGTLPSTKNSVIVNINLTKIKKLLVMYIGETPQEDKGFCWGEEYFDSSKKEGYINIEPGCVVFVNFNGATSITGIINTTSKTNYPTNIQSLTFEYWSNTIFNILTNTDTKRTPIDIMNKLAFNSNGRKYYWYAIGIE